MECPRCSAQITGKKCSYCGYEVPEEKKPDYADEITDSLGRIAGKILSDVADSITDDNISGETNHSEQGTYKEYNTIFGKARVRTGSQQNQSTGNPYTHQNSNQSSNQNFFNGNNNPYTGQNVRRMEASKKKSYTPVILIASLVIIFLILFIVGGVMTFYGLSKYSDDMNGYSSMTGNYNKNTDLSGEYLVKTLEKGNTKMVIYTNTTDTEEYTASGQAAEYISEMKNGLDDTPCYIEATDGVVSVLYKKSPVIFVIEALGDNHYLVTAGQDLFYEISSDDELQPGKVYDSYYEWRDDMKMYFTSECDLFAPFSLSTEVQNLEERTVKEQTKEKEYSAYFVTMDGKEYMISKDVYELLQNSHIPDCIEINNDMGVLMIGE